MTLNEIKQLMIDLAGKNGIDEDTLKSETTENGTFFWSIDWGVDLDREFEQIFQHFSKAMELYSAASERDDDLAAKAGLQEARIAVQDLANFFDAFRNDILKMTVDNRFKWPKFPDCYKIHEYYKYTSR